jgi:molybdate transport system ATP-binding protein
MSLDFDLKLKRREFELSLRGSFCDSAVGVCGPSGSGKTTLLLMLAGLLRPDEGWIRFNGKVLYHSDSRINIPPHKRQMGVVFQDKLLFPHLSIRDNLLFGLRYVKNPRLSLDFVVDLLELSNLLDVKPHMISGGEAQRAALGRALMTSPKLLLLDEPFNALDSQLKEKIFPSLIKLKKEVGIPLVLISHEPAEIQALSDVIYPIREGRTWCPSIEEPSMLLRNQVPELSQVPARCK